MTTSMIRFLLLSLVSLGQGAVIGIDFGGRFLKVGIIQPGTGIELVLNEATKRKSSAAAGFNSQDERVYGDDSQNLLGKTPQSQFVMAKLLLGKSVSSPEIKSFIDMLYPYEFLTDEDTNAALIKYGNTTFRGEELVAFVLSYAKQIAEAHAGSTIKDCTITIPPFFNHIQRHAMINAATIAGLNVLSLVHENTAFAFKYGFDKESEFGTEPTNVIFYDLGATSLKVTAASFFTTVGKKNKTTGGMVIKGVAWDATLGGRDFDQVVLDMLSEEFNKKNLKDDDDVRHYTRAVGKLRKTAESVKDVLSANQQFQVGIEAVHDDRDLKMIVKRAAFEERAAPLWERLGAPLAAVLLQANWTKEEVHRVEVIGGATRIPNVKQVAKDFFGRSQLDGSINGDEAGALGATLYAAKLSTSFRLRDFVITDAFPHAIYIKLSGGEADRDDESDGEDKSNSKSKDKLLFKANTKFPHKKLITMTRSEDLFVTLSLRDEDDAATSPIASFNITGVAAAIARMNKDPTKTLVGKPKVSVTFALNSNGLLEVSKSELALEMIESYEDYELVPANETNSNATNATTVVENTTIALDANASANATNATNATRMVRVPVQRERKRLHYTTLRAAKEVLGEVLPINATHIGSCIARNKKLLEAEAIRRLIAEAKNDLESFIINTRDQLNSEDNVQKVSTEEERTGLLTDLETSEDWLYEEGRDLSASAYKSKKKDLDAMTAPLFLRLAELEARPRVVDQSKDAINWTMTILETWASERPEVTAAERAKVAEMCVNFTTWLDAATAKQDALELHEVPAFVSSQVSSKLEPVEKEIRRLIKKPKPKVKKVPLTNGTSTNGTSANTTNATSAEDAGGNSSAEFAAETDLSDEDELPGHDEL